MVCVRTVCDHHGYIAAGGMVRARVGRIERRDNNYGLGLSVGDMREKKVHIVM